MPMKNPPHPGEIILAQVSQRVNLAQIKSFVVITDAVVAVGG